MIQHQQSSGNLVADKRADYARSCAETNQFMDAVDVQRQALELAPDWAMGWFGLGEYLEKTEDIARAQEAYATALRLSPADYFGASLKIAYLSQTTLNIVPAAYSEALFDGYADRFDHALVQELAYVAPERLAALLKLDFASIKFAKAIDLGCGTGLMAQQVHTQIDHLIGVDLSASMLAKAKGKGLYDDLIKADAVDALAQLGNVDLVMAADVFIYVANLEPVFTAVSQCLAESGLFLFSIEKHSGIASWQLLESMRHAHAPAYIEKLLQQNSLNVLARETGIIRNDAGKPVTGLFYLAQKQRNV